MTESQGQGKRLLFFSGAEMWPTDLLARCSDGRFVARSRVLSSEEPVASALDAHLEGEVWGILVEATPNDTAGQALTVETDDGRRFDAALGTEQLVAGDPDDVLRSARYWELPPSYLGRLRFALEAVGIEVIDEEPRDDGILG
jgi:hypothetical protein